MFKKPLALACLLASSLSVNASIQSVDWHTAGDNLITRDTNTGLDWLDLTETTSLSFDDITSEMTNGGLYEGWGYASAAQLSMLIDGFGGVGPYNGWSTDNEGLVAVFISYFGETNLNSQITDGILSDAFSTSNRSFARFAEESNQGYEGDYIQIPYSGWDSSFARVGIGSFLVRPSEVPIPAAAWLFGSALIGLVGIGRKRKQAA